MHAGLPLRGFRVLLTVVLLAIAVTGVSGTAAAGALFDQARETFLTASNLVREKRYAAAKRRLDALWRKYPAGSPVWYRARPKDESRNFGRPPFYYALRMLTDIAGWRSGRYPGRGNAKADPVRMTVLLVPRSEGPRPKNRFELERGQGSRVVNRLDMRLGHAPGLIEQCLWLFGEYVSFISGGRFRLESRTVTLDRLSVPVRATAAPIRFAGLDDKAWSGIWKAVDPKILSRTDWWWVLYPSHVPNEFNAFRTTEFVAGGMGLGPKGEPVFIIDDLWLLRKPPHLGHGPYSDLERQAYLPQWLQHEFFHHLFRLYPQFRLETKSHQWFDRSAWPADFVGTHEADYFHEALHKRLLDADPPLHETLRYAHPSPSSLDRLTPEDLAGTYRRDPVENDWHVGELAVGGDGATLVWRNRAGVAWRLTPDFSVGRLISGPDNPYYDSAAAQARDFTLVLGRSGPRPTVAGFRFQGELYRRE